MKIKKFKFRQILKLHLLKSKVYEHYEKKNNSDHLTDATLSHIIANFKKSLQVIFQYHQTNKRILFVGLPSSLESKINRLTNHVAVPPTFDLQGVISSANSVKFLKTRKGTGKSYSLSLLPKLSKKPDLVVLLSHYKQESVIYESHIAKVPLIIFEDVNSVNKSWSNYNVLGVKSDLTSSNQKNIFFLGLNFLFKKFK